MADEPRPEEPASEIFNLDLGDIPKPSEEIFSLDADDIAAAAGASAPRQSPALIPAVVAEKTLSLDDDVIMAEEVIPFDDDVIVAEEVIPLDEAVVVAEEVITLGEDAIVAEEVITLGEDVIVTASKPTAAAPSAPVAKTTPKPGPVTTPAARPAFGSSSSAAMPALSGEPNRGRPKRPTVRISIVKPGEKSPFAT